MALFWLLCRHCGLSLCHLLRSARFVFENVESHGHLIVLKTKRNTNPSEAVMALWIQGLQRPFAAQLLTFCLLSAACPPLFRPAPDLHVSSPCVGSSVSTLQQPPQSFVFFPMSPVFLEAPFCLFMSIRCPLCAPPNYCSAVGAFTMHGTCLSTSMGIGLRFHRS